MLHPAASLSLALLLALPAPAQAPVPRAGRVRAPVQDAGTLHLATGVWSSPTSSATGRIVYNNDAPQQRFLRIEPGQEVADFGVVPVQVDAGGSEAGQLINGFQFAYATREVRGSFAYVVSFYDERIPCARRSSSNALARVVLDDLPGSPQAGRQSAWQVTVDLRFTEHEFLLLGAARGHFAFGLELTSTVHGPGGPIMAGDPDGRFDQAAGFGAGTDMDDSRGVPGTGLGTDDSYRLSSPDGSDECIRGVPNSPISYASFHLQLYADTSSASSGGTGVGTNYCDGWAETEDAIYWTATGAGRILSATPSGDQVENIFASQDGSPFAIDVDVVGRKLYWTEYGVGPMGRGRIRRSDLNGWNAEELVGPELLDFPAGIALDLRGRKMYWGDRDAPHVGRANLDGSEVEILVPGCRALGVDLDLAQGKMYWTEESDKIRRANLDGSSVETLLAGLNSPNDIAVDSARRKMYWTEDGRRVKRANLDGTHVEVISAGVGAPFGISVDSSHGKLYWSNYYGQAVMRSNLDGSDREVVVSNMSQDGFGLAFATSVPPPGHILALGSESVADNDLTLVVSGVPASLPGVFFFGAREAFIPLGQGFRCVGGRVQRLWPPVLSDFAGVASRRVDLTTEPGFSQIGQAAPVSLNFQYWHRVSGSSSLSDATRVHFVE